jgi:hypothetical protein
MEEQLPEDEQLTRHLLNYHGLTADFAVGGITVPELQSLRQN